MIVVTRLNGKQLILNSDLIELMESTPDSVITLTNGNKYVVSDSMSDLIGRITEYRRRCHPLYRSEEESVKE